MKYLCLFKNAAGEVQTETFEADAPPEGGSYLRIQKEDDTLTLRVIRQLHHAGGVIDLRCHRVQSDDGGYWP
jgi:hypothetical protein